ncbi:fructose-6-phosphate aldolase [Enterococcus sp. MJM12]|uniref:Probable transaldolase n=1 Tax=Candidatus Enterococcus myersii TaxID=2815322 RepID=A0ABS3H5M0_9ENTE|nr:fructose-6-phosphate aldolase [Enterococcus sp. MJM12]MBO0448751.1 fructose-6-phosphate aldolase [Enterococcus sp. MJM12]
MKFFLDTANVDDIRRIDSLGLVDGVTTNPSIIAKEGRDFEEVIKEIASITSGPVSAEVIALKADEMVAEAHQISKWGENVVVKIPMTEEGLKAVHILSQEGIKTNVTLIFSVSQGLMAMKAGATFISPFIGRLEDIGSNATELIADLRKIIDMYQFDSEIIAASIRTPYQLESVSKLGAHIATIPGELFPKLWTHPLTDQGIQSFLADWSKFNK